MPTVMLSKNIKFVSYLCMTVFGISIFFLNANRVLDFPGAMLASLLLMVGPVAFGVFGPKSKILPKTQSFTLAILPIVFISYIYAIRMGVPTGFSDTHLNIFAQAHLFDSNGKIVFSNVSTVSFNFVGMNSIHRILGLASGFGIVPLAVYFPPAINLAVIILVYVIVNRLHSHRMGMLAMMLFGWENQILIFGQEMRTQTMGTLLIFSLISIIVISLRPTARLKSSSIHISEILLLVTLVTVSFASIYYAGILLIVLLLTYSFLKKRRFRVSALQVFSWRTYALFLAFAIVYLAFVSNGMENILNTVVLLMKETTENVYEASLRTGQEIYGPYAKIVNYSLWGLFILGSAYYLRSILKERMTSRIVFFFSFAFLFFFGVVNMFIGPLSAGRVYAISFILIALVTSYIIISLAENRDKSINSYFARIAIVLVLVILLSSSVIRIPQYVVGNTEPMRSKEAIDTVPFWDAGDPQYAVAGYLNEESPGHQPIHLYILNPSYFFMGVLYDKKMITKESRNFEDFAAGDVLVLHNKFYGEDYTDRDLLPASDAFSSFAQVYSNGDFAVYYVSE